MRRAKRRRHLPPRSGEPCPHGTVEPGEFLAAAIEATDPRCRALCAQARRALELAIAAECRDEALNELILIDVWPDPSPRRLRVWLRGPADLDERRREHVLRRLAAARGFLRSRVAEAIHRKRTPELVFELLASEPGPTERTR